MRHIRLLLYVLILAVAAPALGAPRDYVVTPGAPNEVVFESSAAIETFQGKTRALSGSIHVDPAALEDSVSLHFEVDLATLSTGLPKRDKHMRENHLEVATYPKATFDGVAVLGPARQLALGVKTPLDVEGTFAIHGASHRLHLTVETTLVRDKSGEAIQFQTAFPVSLAGYGIPRPEFLVLKLADVQKVSVRGIATSRTREALAGH